jgi:hypothetical protein
MLPSKIPLVISLYNYRTVYYYSCICFFHAVQKHFYSSFPPSFLLALQLGVSFGLLNNLPPFFSPSEADYVVSEQFSFYGMRLLASRPTPKPGGPGYSCSSSSYPLTCLAWVTLCYCRHSSQGLKSTQTPPPR